MPVSPVRLAHLVELLSQWWENATNELAVLRSVDADLLRNTMWSAPIDAEVQNSIRLARAEISIDSFKPEPPVSSAISLMF